MRYCQMDNNVLENMLKGFYLKGENNYKKRKQIYRL